MSTIRFKYIFDDDYNPKYINGAFGGISPKGEIVVNFFLERIPVPVSQTHKILEDGKLELLPESQEPGDLPNSLVRFVQSGIILNAETAKAVGEWLLSQASDMETKSRGGATS